MIENLKNRHSTIAFWVFACISVILLIGGAVTPPPFVIDNSILIAVSELFAFAALAVIPSAIKEGRSVKLKHKDTEIEVK